VRVGGQARAYSFDWLARKVDAQGRWNDQLGGRRVRIQFDRQARSAEAFDAAGRPRPPSLPSGSPGWPFTRVPIFPGSPE